MDLTFLKTISLFSQASPETLNTLSQLTKRHFYKKGQVILHHKEAATTFLYVVHGWVKIFKESVEGEEIITDVLTQHHYCGDIFIFQENSKEFYAAQTLSDAEFLMIPISSLKQLVLSDHSLSLSFLQATLRKQQDINMEVEHLSIQNSAQRIGCFILRLCKPNETRNVILCLPYDKALLASRLGMRAETFSRALAKLCEQCNITVTQEVIHIDDINILSHYVCEHCSKKFPCTNLT